jgi:uncharacterized protein (DUF952 family)
MRILHAALPGDWAEARRRGSYDISSRGRSLAEQGFLHASTVAQLPTVLHDYYDDLASVVLLVLDVPALAAAGSPVRWDDVPGAATPFPHVYGPVPVAAIGPGNPVVAELAAAHSPGERWRLPDLASYDIAAGPPAP